MATDFNKKDLILSSAIALFATQGIDQTSVSQIMDKSNLAKGTFYLYFLNKEQVIEEAFWHCHRLDVEACNEGLDTIENCGDKLKQRARNAIFWALKHPFEAKLESIYYYYKGILGNGTYKKQFLHYNVVTAIIEEGIEKKHFKALPPDLIGELFFSGAASVLYYIYDHPNEKPNEEAFSLLLEIIVAGIRA